MYVGRVPWLLFDRVAAIGRASRSVRIADSCGDPTRTAAVCCFGLGQGSAGPGWPGCGLPQPQRHRPALNTPSSLPTLPCAGLGRHSVAVFSVGVVSGLVGVACWQLLRRYHSPPPERVFGAVLPMLRANAECRQVLGARLRPGLFKAYAYTGGLRGSRRTLLAYTPRGSSRPHTPPLTLSPPPPPPPPGSLQLMFQVVGEEGVAGMVSVVVRRRLPWRRALEFSSVAVDLPSGERLLLKGGNEDVVFQGYTQLR